MTLVVSPDVWGGEEVEVIGDDHRHLFRALRMQVGDPLRVVDGRGRARGGRVRSIERHRGVVALAEPVPDGEPACSVELAIATIRPERAAWAVEKATEVGAVAVHWFGCERAPRRYGAGQLRRFERVAASAVAQCGRSMVPTVTTLTWQELLERAGSCETRVLDPGGEQSPRATAPELLVVGPEGGLTEAEVEALVERGARSWALGGTILRTETAAVVAAGIAVCGWPSP